MKLKTILKVNPTLYRMLDNCSLALNIRPKYKKNKSGFIGNHSNKFSGGVVISADFELGWAFRYSKKNANPEKMAMQARENFPFLLKLFDEYNIPITWATVGHLFLDKCKKGDHDWMMRIPHFENPWNFLHGDWYDHDPYANAVDAPCWYAPDLIEKILSAKASHEIGCHTFSHINFSDKICPPGVADDEIKACVDIAKKWGLQLNSIVFPGGTYGNIDVIKRYGFKVYRHNVKQKLAYPYKDHADLIVTHSTQMIGRNNQHWDANYHLYRYKQMVKRAIQTRTICHFWFHPSDLFLRKILESLLVFIREQNDLGKLWIGTMRNLSDLKHE